MMRSVALAPLWAVVTANEHFPIHHALVDRINERFARGESTWEAMAVEKNPLAGFTFEQLRALLGLQDAAANATGAEFNVGAVSVPSSFDGRVTFKSCQKAVRNQEHCGSCWAFAAAETLTTNLCVLGAGNPVLSPQDLVSCDTENHACHGGNLGLVWNYIAHKGIRSDACVPYTSGGGDDARCSASCTGSGSDDHYSCPVAPSALKNDAGIQAAVVSGGAVEVGFSVYSDFMNYKSGIYKHKDGNYMGGHAVKVVGYGKASSTFYWIVQNSWGPTWGEGGFFRIMNWEEDSASNFARGGGNACVKGLSPTPTPPTPDCQDNFPFCDLLKSRCATDALVAMECKKTCGCCDANKPVSCTNDENSVGVVV